MYDYFRTKQTQGDAFVAAWDALLQQYAVAYPAQVRLSPVLLKSQGSVLLGANCRTVVRR